MRLSVLLSFILISSFEAKAQNAYVKMGQQALMNGDFKTAVRQLEKACYIDSSNANAYLMLGYSYYHSENYRKSVAAYSKVIDIKPADPDAYYWRSRAKSYLAKDIQLKDTEREKHMLGAINDMSKALLLQPGETRFYQIRGLAYKDYGTFKLQGGTKIFDKPMGQKALQAAISDFKKVLENNAGRYDISELMASCREKLSALNAHH